MDKLKIIAAALVCAAAFPAFAEEPAASDQAAADQAVQPAAEQPEGAQAQQDGPQPDENGYYQGAGIYVSDNVNALLRSGPAGGYRTVGVLHPGDQVVFSRYSRDKRYIEVQTQDGRKVWMRFGDLQAAPAAKNQLDQLKAANEELKKKLEEAQKLAESASQQAQAAGAAGNSQAEIGKLNEEIASLKSENAGLRKALEEGGNAQAAAAAAAAASTSDSRRELDLQMRWWIQGALIAFGGAVAGIILVMLPKPSRKRRYRY
jgi:SH3 domain protein